MSRLNSSFTEKGETRKKRGRGRLITALALGSAGAALFAFSAVSQPQGGAVLERPLAAAPTPMSFADLVEEVGPSVVSVFAEGAPEGRAGPAGPRGFPRFEGFGGGPFPPGRESPSRQSQGSGFIVDPSGYVVTNHHVIEGAERVRLALADGRELDAEVIGTDAETDLAVLKVDTGEDLPSVEFATDVNLRVGDWVVALGNPFGFGGSVTSGIVSSMGRDIGRGPYTDFIQIDAPINRGNSGGPTFDLQGRVVGVNTAIFSPSGGNVGIGFAIPARTASNVVEQIIADGGVTRGWLGVSIQSITPKLADAMGLEQEEGALVAQVFDGSPAERAGLTSGDVIVRVGEHSVSDSRALTQRVAAYAPGEAAAFHVIRDGKPQRFKVTLAERERAEPLRLASHRDSDLNTERLGLLVRPVDNRSRRELGLPDDVNGALVTRVFPGGPASREGVRDGDIILEVDQTPVTDEVDIAEALERAEDDGKSSALFLIRAREGGFRYAALSLTQS